MKRKKKEENNRKYIKHQKPLVFGLSRFRTVQWIAIAMKTPDIK